MAPPAERRISGRRVEVSVSVTSPQFYLRLWLRRITPPRRPVSRRAREFLSWRPLYPSYREGLTSLLKADNTSD
ncbi:MAG: hypothetical protein MPL62_01040 [Alphaproteobacteria bacterium]|nr:hypothetical protein [Alphaproteobacteria bacterium]